MINFVIYCPSGTVFWKSVDASGKIKNAEYLFKLMDDMVEEVGEHRVVQVVTDNAATYKSAGTMLMEKRRHLYWVPCSEHCIDLMLENIAYDICRLCGFQFSIHCSFPMEWFEIGRFRDALFPFHLWCFSCTCVQGGYFHGLNSLTYGVDVDKIRWLGILQRIAIGYIIAALCEIWFSKTMPRDYGNFKNYYLQWFAVFLLSCMYLSLLYGLYVPDWQFKVQQPTSSLSSTDDGYVIKTVKCAVRGDLGPACNSAGMIDRYILGIEHLYRKPNYRNLRECLLENGQVLDNSPAWCQAPFDPEGILSSLMAAVTSIIGLQFGHVLVQIEEHKSRLFHWSLLSLVLFAVGAFLVLIGLPLNKALYTTSYMLITTSSAGITFCALYLIVDVCGYRCMFFVLEWMGRHSLSIFVLLASNLAIIAIQGFYWKTAQNNAIHWVIALFVKN